MRTAGGTAEGSAEGIAEDIAEGLAEEIVEHKHAAVVAVAAVMLRTCAAAAVCAGRDRPLEAAERNSARHRSAADITAESELAGQPSPHQRHQHQRRAWRIDLACSEAQQPCVGVIGCCGWQVTQ